jgi:hypothetical protein
MQKGSLPIAVLERSVHPDLRMRRYQSAERSHVKSFPSRSFGLAITISSVFTSSSQHDVSYSNTRKKTIPNSPSYTYQPAVRASNVAALPRAGRALGHTLVSKLGLQRRHVALSTGYSVFLVDGSPMLVGRLLAYSAALYGSNAVILQMFYLFFLHDLALLESRCCD